MQGSWAIYTYRPIKKAFDWTILIKRLQIKLLVVWIFVIEYNAYCIVRVNKISWHKPNFDYFFFLFSILGEVVNSLYFDLINMQQIYSLFNVSMQPRFREFPVELTNTFFFWGGGCLLVFLNVCALFDCKIIKLNT